MRMWAQHQLHETWLDSNYSNEQKSNWKSNTNKKTLPFVGTQMHAYLQAHSVCQIHSFTHFVVIRSEKISNWKKCIRTDDDFVCYCIKSDITDAAKISNANNKNIFFFNNRCTVYELIVWVWNIQSTRMMVIPPWSEMWPTKIQIIHQTPFYLRHFI